MYACAYAQTGRQTENNASGPIYRTGGSTKTSVMCNTHIYLPNVWYLWTYCVLALEQWCTQLELTLMSTWVHRRTEVLAWINELRGIVFNEDRSIQKVDRCIWIKAYSQLHPPSCINDWMTLQQTWRNCVLYTIKGHWPLLVTGAKYLNKFKAW